MDRSDVTRKAYLSAVLDRMRAPEEDLRIRSEARSLLDKKITRGLIGEGHAARWRAILEMSRDDIAAHLLGEGEAGREMRHAHLFAGALPAREANMIRRRALETAKGRLDDETPFCG